MQISSLASVYHKPADTFVSRQRQAVQRADELQVGMHKGHVRLLQPGVAQGARCGGLCCHELPGWHETCQIHL